MNPERIKLNVEVEEQEIIIAAALSVKDNIYTAANHALALMELTKANPNWKNEGEFKILDGFVTSTGRFVDREEANIIAKNSNQIKDVGSDDSTAKLDSHQVKGLNVLDDDFAD